MDNDGAQIGPVKRTDIGGSPSATHRLDRDLLWHPKRKSLLPGKKIMPEFPAKREGAGVTRSLRRKRPQSG